MASKSGTVYIDPPDDSNIEPEESKVDRLAERAGWIIFETSSKTSLFRPYSDRITISPNRVTITKRSLFGRDEYPMPVENVTGARVFSHFRLASLMIDTFGIEKPEPVRNLNVNDARLARRYILALIECNKNDVDLIDLSLEELREKLKSIGTVQFSTEDDKYHEI